MSLSPSLNTYRLDSRSKPRFRGAWLARTAQLNMASQFLLVHLILVLCGLALSQSLTGDANTIQLDLIFPQNNTAYKPTFPLPIAFAIHNGSDAVSSRNLHLGWWLYRVDPEAPEGRYFVVSGGFNEELDQRPTSIPNDFLLLNGTQKLQDKTGKFLLEYILSMIGNCTLEGPPANHSNGEFGYDAQQKGTVYFDISENGDMVDIGASGPCAEPLNVMKVEGFAVHGNISCPVLSDSYTHTETCAFPIDEKIHNRIKAEMEALIGCKNSSWPNITKEPNSCPGTEPSMGVAVTAIDSVLTVILAGVFGFAIMVV